MAVLKLTLTNRNKMIHIFPVSERHLEDTTCECFPRVVEEDGEIICVHQSFNALELTEQGFQIGLESGIKARCGHELIEGDIVETVQGNRFIVLTIFGVKPCLMLRDKQMFDLNESMTPNLFYIGNVVDDLELRHSFFYAN